jgi:hypothetical protein
MWFHMADNGERSTRLTTVSAKSLDRSLIKMPTISKSENAQQRSYFYLPPPDPSGPSFHTFTVNTPSHLANLSHMFFLTFLSHLSDLKILTHLTHLIHLYHLDPLNLLTN